MRKKLSTSNLIMFPCKIGQTFYLLDFVDQFIDHGFELWKYSVKST